MSTGGARVGRAPTAPKNGSQPSLGEQTQHLGYRMKFAGFFQVFTFRYFDKMNGDLHTTRKLSGKPSLKPILTVNPL